MELHGKDVLVVGAKRSGFAAVELLLRHGAKVRAMDSQTLAPEDQARFDAAGVPVSPQQPEYLGDPELIVLSPGVPLDLPLFSSRRIIGEVELASYFLQGPLIGITGSNGKTTTTALTGHLLKECGIPCQVGGNIGTAVTSLIDSSQPDRWNVLELSSFQLESIEHFHARIAACLNVTPDHLDRHRTFEAYAAAKGKLFSGLGTDDFAVLNFDDPTCRGYADLSSATVLWFSTKSKVPHGLWLQNDEIWFDNLPLMPRSMIKLRGLHNVENVMAAALMAHLAGARPEQIAHAVSTFPGVEHRIEFVRELDGVQYFNDSKATNVDATLKAIDAFAGNLWIILGGKDKGSAYLPLREPLHAKATGVLLIGAEPPYPYAAAPLIQQALQGAVPMAECGSLEVAVQHARSNAQSGDTVLLSPACASFDQFQSYEDRGRRFKQLVAELF